MDRSFDPRTKELKFVVLMGTTLYPIELLSVSFILFHNRNDLEVVSLYDFVNKSPSGTFHGASEIVRRSFNTNVTNNNIPRPRLRNTPVVIDTFDEMFGLHGVMVQTEASFDNPILFSTLPNFIGVHTCISKKDCRKLSGHMIYEQNNMYDITPTCYVCDQLALFNESLGACQCRVDYVLINNKCMPSSSVCGAN